MTAVPKPVSAHSVPLRRYLSGVASACCPPIGLVKAGVAGLAARDVDTLRVSPRTPVRSGGVVPEASLEQTEAGAVPATPGWFVLNARDARWGYTPGMGHGLPLTGIDEDKAETLFPMLGMAIRVMNPGEPSTTYHWETEQKGSVPGTV
jgi:hypothetical protein